MIDKHELLFVVDENNNPLTPLPRKIVHCEGHWHRTSHIWVVNEKKEVLCQKRSKYKDIHPGHWDMVFGGHMAPGSSYKENALDELQEEIGLEIPPDTIHTFKVYKSQLGREYQGIFYTVWNGRIEDLLLEKEELDEVRWYTFEEIEKIISSQNKEWILLDYASEFLAFLKEKEL